MGQRAITLFPFFIVYDRTANTAVFKLGGATSLGSDNSLALKISISVITSLLMYGLIIYMVILRRNRDAAMIWLDENRKVLLKYSDNNKTEEEILQSLVKAHEFNAKEAKIASD